MKRSIDIFLFSSYSYLANIMFIILDVLPHPIRIVVFKLIMGKVGKSVLIDYKTYFRYPSKIRLGNAVAVNRGCEFYAVHGAKGGTITVGNHVALGPHVKIFAGGHDYTSVDLPVTAGPVVIEDFVWIGGNSVILQGVTIGEGAIIGAGSVVTRNIPPYSVAVGNPACVSKTRTLTSSQERRQDRNL